MGNAPAQGPPPETPGRLQRLVDHVIISLSIFLVVWTVARKNLAVTHGALLAITSDNVKLSLDDATIITSVLVPAPIIVLLVIGSIRCSAFLKERQIENTTARCHDTPMDYDKDKVDEMVLALLFLTLHEGNRSWKGHDWDALGRLHKKGMILDPVGKAKSVALTEEGMKLCEELFRKHFCPSR